jgi:hypothetical protein
VAVESRDSGAAINLQGLCKSETNELDQKLSGMSKVTRQRGSRKIWATKNKDRDGEEIKHHTSSKGKCTIQRRVMWNGGLRHEAEGESEQRRHFLLDSGGAFFQIHEIQISRFSSANLTVFVLHTSSFACHVYKWAAGFHRTRRRR